MCVMDSSISPAREPCASLFGGKFHPRALCGRNKCTHVMMLCLVVCCSLQCVAVCCTLLQCVAVCCSVLQCAAVCCSVLQCVAVCCSVLQCVTRPVATARAGPLVACVCMCVCVFVCVRVYVSAIFGGRLNACTRHTLEANYTCS